MNDGSKDEVKHVERIENFVREMILYLIRSETLSH